MIPFIKRVTLVLGLSFVIVFPAHIWADVIDQYVESLNSPRTRAELRLKQASRPVGVVNRLDVLFEEDLSAAARGEALRRIGREFSRLLFDWRLVPTVRVVERDTLGRFLNQIIITVTQAPINRSSALSSRSPC